MILLNDLLFAIVATAITIAVIYAAVWFIGRERIRRWTGISRDDPPPRWFWPVLSAGIVVVAVPNLVRAILQGNWLVASLLILALALFAIAFIRRRRIPRDH